MGWLDRIKALFGRSSSFDVDLDEPEEAAPPPAPVARTETAAPVVPKPAKAAKPPKVKPPKERKPKREKRKAHKGLVVPEAPATPKSEVLSVEEAERRYGKQVREVRAEPVVAAPAPVEAEPEPPPIPVATERPPARRKAAPASRYEGLLSRADALLAVPGARARDLASARRELVDGWRRLGEPDPEDAERLVAARDACLATFDQRLEAAAGEIAKEQAANLEAKRAVVAEAVALAEREDLRGAGPAMGELRRKLRAIAKGDEAGETEVRQGFAAAEARLAARQQEQRSTRDAAREQGLSRLTQLVEQAEALARSADPEVAAERVKSLQTTWKTVRFPGPRGETDELWKRFRAACDAVFEARTRARTEASAATLEKLEAVVVRAEQLAAEGDVLDPDREIDALVTAWKKAGRAPRDAQQALWERLAAAMEAMRSPSVDLSGQDDRSLSFRPFEGLE